MDMWVDGWMDRRCVRADGLMHGCIHLWNAVSTSPVRHQFLVNFLPAEMIDPAPPL